MSEVKRYNPELEKDIGLGLPCLSMFSNPYGEWVKYKDYAALQQKLDEETHRAEQNATYLEALTERMMAAEKERDALAVENLDLKHPGTYLPSKRETPATDAYLNSVRADAIVDAASRIAAQAWEEDEGAGMVAAVNALAIIEKELRAEEAK